MEALADHPPGPRRAWNKIPPKRASAIIDLALAEAARSPRELAVKCADRYRYYVSESTLYRLLKTKDLIASPAFIVLQAADGTVRLTDSILRNRFLRTVRLAVGSTGTKRRLGVV